MKIGDEIHRFERCSSTLDEARTLALAGRAEGTVVVAGEQTAGRGTKGRTWFSPPGRGLYVTVLLRPACPRLSLLPLAVGLAARDAAAASSDLDIRLKWPNDLVWEAKKLGGVVCEGGGGESGPRFVLAGIGVNVAQAPEGFPPGLRDRATSLASAAGRPVGTDDLLRLLCESLETWYNIFIRGTGDKIVHAFQEIMTFTPGDRVRLETGGAAIDGTFIGLDAFGGLVCEDGGRRTAYYSAEVQALERG